MSPRSLAARLTVRDILGPDALAARTIPGFEARDSQIRMAESILERLHLGGTLVVEAPTGVGKTLAYLVPAVLSGRKIVVSTNTKNLQDQIVDKDLPLLARVLREAGVSLDRASPEDEGPAPPGVVRYALMKGRNNYLCLDRLEKKTKQRGFGFDRDLLVELDEWAKTTPRGDRAELVGLPERSPDWDELDARSEICTGARCPKYDACFVVRMRREAQSASLVIVNHHLLLADLSMRAAARLTEGRTFGEVIPECDALILDEAHTLEETASEYFGGRVSTHKLERYARDLTTYLTGRAASPLAAPLTLESTAAVTAAGSVFRHLPKRDGRFRVGKGQDQALAASRASVGNAVGSFSRLATLLDEDGAVDPTADGLARRARELGESLRFVLSAEDADYVYWSEWNGKHGSLGASPIQVASLLREHLFECFGAVVLTSATLAAGADDCVFFRRSVGAPEEASAFVLGSPYDFSKQAALYLPHDAPDPTDARATDELARIGGALIDAVGGGAMFLFTSYRVMNAVHARLSPHLKYPVLLQGEKPKRELLRELVDRAPAVLFATASFWEGVDVPGDPLRLVLIDRLPFDSPGDPLVAARTERLEAEGKSPFNAYHLPRAILRLKQGFGRLVRSKADRGVVAILDRRLQSKAYGRRFLHALPPARRLAHLEDLEAWLRSSDRGAEG